MGCQSSGDPQTPRPLKLRPSKKWHSFKPYYQVMGQTWFKPAPELVLGSIAGFKTKREISRALSRGVDPFPLKHCAEGRWLAVKRYYFSKPFAAGGISKFRRHLILAISNWSPRYLEKPDQKPKPTILVLRFSTPPPHWFHQRPPKAPRSGGPPSQRGRARAHWQHVVEVAPDLAMCLELDKPSWPFGIVHICMCVYIYICVKHTYIDWVNMIMIYDF